MRNVFWRQIRLLLVVFIGYLFHVTVMTQLDTTVSINLPLVILSVVIVGYPRYKAFWVGAVYGILLETMVPGVKLLNLVFYPICAMLMSLFFTDKSAARLQYDMSNHRRGRNRSVYLRTPLCALCAALLYEAVSIIYIAMSSAELTSAFFTRCAHRCADDDDDRCCADVAAASAARLRRAGIQSNGERLISGQPGELCYFSL